MNNARGQSLIEVLLGFAVASIVIAAITITVINSLSNAQQSSAQNTATQYAQDAIDKMRQFRNNDIVTFRTFGTTGSNNKYCFASSCVKLSSVTDDPCGPPSGSPQHSCQDNINIPRFTRELRITIQSSPCFPTIATSRTQADIYYTQVGTFVKWRDAQCPANQYCHEVRLFDCLN